MDALSGEILEFLVEKSVGAFAAFVLIAVFKFPESWKEAGIRVIFLSFASLSFTLTTIIYLEREITPMLVATASAMTATIAYLLLRFGQAVSNYSVQELFEFASLIKSKRPKEDDKEDKK